MIPRLPKGFSHPMRIGEGAFSSVYRVRQKALDRWVAIKMHKQNGVEERRELLKEARLQAGMGIPCIPAVFDAFEWRSQVCIVMQWVKGVPLTLLISRLTTDQQRLALADAFITALAHLHRAGYVHRDIKPANVLVSPDEGLYLVDFGFTKNASGGALESVSGHIKGTPAFMAPEIFQGRPDIDWMRTDIYSAGKLLNQLLPRNWNPEFLSSLVEDEPARRPASGMEVMERWRLLPDMKLGSGAIEWQSLSAQLASDLLAKNLYLAARQLGGAGRTDESYWLVTECLEENSEFPDALDYMASLPQLGRRARRLRMAWISSGSLVIIFLIIGAFLIGKQNQPSDSGSKPVIAQANTFLLPQSDLGYSGLNLPLHEVGTPAQSFNASLLIVGETGTAVLRVDGNAAAFQSGKPVAIPYGLRRIQLYSDEREIFNEQISFLPFQTRLLKISAMTSNQRNSRHDP